VFSKPWPGGPSLIVINFMTRAGGIGGNLFYFFLKKGGLGGGRGSGDNIEITKKKKKGENFARSLEGMLGLKWGPRGNVLGRRDRKNIKKGLFVTGGDKSNLDPRKKEKPENQRSGRRGGDLGRKKKNLDNSLINQKRRRDMKSPTTNNSKSEGGKVQAPQI